MTKLFLSYRREDSKHATGRLYLEMRKEFSSRDIFFDVENIEGGVDFVDKLESTVARSDVLLALIGRKWNEEKRLLDTRNHVRRELAAANSNGVAILPILIDDAPIPSRLNLPEELQFILKLNALRLRHESFSSDASVILDSVRGLIIARSSDFKLPEHVARRMNKKLEEVRTIHERLDLTPLPVSVRNVVDEARITELKTIECKFRALAASERARDAAESARKNESGFSYEDFGTKNGGSGFWAGEGLANHRNGFGELVSSTSDGGRYSYSGQWSENTESGYGVMKWFSPEGTLNVTAQGTITKGRLNGYGCKEMGEGHSSAGEFQDEKIEGLGIYTWPNGRRYEGEWSNGQFHGLGVQWEGAGTRPIAGRWRQGKFEEK
ncbi:MAG: TIR domain-containing protein [Pseudomonadota bacterium]